MFGSREPRFSMSRDEITAVLARGCQARDEDKEIDLVCTARIACYNKVLYRREEPFRPLTTRNIKPGCPVYHTVVKT